MVFKNDLKTNFVESNVTRENVARKMLLEQMF